MALSIGCLSPATDHDTETCLIKYVLIAVLVLPLDNEPLDRQSFWIHSGKMFPRSLVYLSVFAVAAACGSKSGKDDPKTLGKIVTPGMIEGLIDNKGLLTNPSSQPACRRQLPAGRRRPRARLRQRHPSEPGAQRGRGDLHLPRRRPRAGLHAERRRLPHDDRSGGRRKPARYATCIFTAAI